MKKILSILIALSVVMTSVAAGAQVILTPGEYEESIFRFDVGEFLGNSAGYADENDPDVRRMKFLESLGIWDDASKPKDSLVTMTEFSIIMSKLRLGSENPFIGVYNKNANEENVTYKIAYEYLLEALGYYYRCSEYSDFEQGIQIVAADVGLISENPENIHSYITRNELAKMIERASMIDICVMEYMESGGYKYTVVDGKTLLNSVHNIHAIEGFVNAIHGLAVFGGASLREGYIQIDRRNINTSGLKLDKYFGSYVNAYAKYDKDINEYSIVYIDYAPSHISYEIDFSKIVDIKNNSLIYLDDNVEQEFDISELEYITENGNSLDSIYDISDFNTNDGKIILTASNKRGEIDTAIIYKYNYFTVAYNDLNQNRIGLKFAQKYNGENFIQIDANGVNKVYIDDVVSDYTQLKVNSAIRVFQSNNGYTEIYASNKKITGSVDMIYENTVEITGKEFLISKDVLRHIDDCKNNSTITASDKIKELQIGDTGTFYAIGGVIAGYTSQQDYTYGYLKSVYIGKTSIDPSLTFRIFTQDGEWIDAVAADKIELDGVQGVNNEQLHAKIKENLHIVNDLVRFKLNNNKQLVGLDTVIVSSAEFQSADDVEMEYSYNGQVSWTYWCFGKTYIDQNTAIFVVPEDKSKENEYKIIANTSLPYNGGNGPVITLDMYTPNDFLQCAAAIFHGSLTATASDTSTFYMHVESIRKIVIDPDTLERGYRVIGKQYVNGSAKATGSIADVSIIVNETRFNSNPFAIGDYITAERSDGEAFSWEIMYPGGVVPDVDSITSGAMGLEIVVGTVKRVDVANSYIIVDINGEERLLCPRAKGIIDLNKNKTIPATMSDFHPGDRVCSTIHYGHSAYVFKNVN